MKIQPADKFFRLTVISFEGRNKSYDSLWLCQCDCGHELIVRGGALKNGHTKSCGCLQKERVSKSHTTHGFSHEKLYKVWIGIKGRCYNPKDWSFKNYGARGILIYKEWNENYMAFRNWSKINGYKEGLTIDRINNDGNYEPSNCRWIPKSIQSKNRRNRKILTFNGITKKVIDWACITNIPGRNINQRIRSGWSPERALTTKI